MMRLKWAFWDILGQLETLWDILGQLGRLFDEFEPFPSHLRPFSGPGLGALAWGPCPGGLGLGALAYGP